MESVLKVNNNQIFWHAEPFIQWLVLFQEHLIQADHFYIYQFNNKFSYLFDYINKRNWIPGPLLPKDVAFLHSSAIAINQTAVTGCPTYFLPFSKAYILMGIWPRSKIPTVLDVSWRYISYEKKKFFRKISKKGPSCKNWSTMAPPIKVLTMKQIIDILCF